MRQLDEFEKKLSQQIIENPHGALLQDLLDKYLEGVLIHIEIRNHIASLLISNAIADSYIQSKQLDNLYGRIISAVNLLELLQEERYIVIAQAAHEINDPYEFGPGMQNEERTPFIIPDQNITNMLINYLNRYIYPTQALTDYVNNGFRTPEDRRHDRQISVTRIGILVTALIGILAFVLNISSLYINNKNVEMSLEANRIRLGADIRQQEDRVYELALRESDLMAFYADPASGLKPFEIADNYIRLILSRKEYQEWERRYGKWESVQNLMRILYGPDDFHNPAKVKLRKAYDMAEHLLYMLQTIHDAGRKNLLNKEEWQARLSYIDDKSANPLFLSAVYFGHSSGYITRDFAGLLRERILNDDRNKRIAAAVYSDILKPDWIDHIGKRQYNEARKKAD
ncbi:MAG TPA: hypothetical protein VN328_09855 [Thermodesulfovibrionales bacterium]|nr:hypothetical protein [Thermodesulfovibrionales bacterium]